MARNTTATKSAPQPTVEAPASNVSEALNAVLGNQTLTQRKEPVDLPRQPSNARSRGPVIAIRNVLTEVSEERKAELELRSEVIKATSQTLAHASDLYAEGDDKAKEAKGIADKAAIQLYQARAAGVMTAETVSEVLRNAFGAQKKGARTVRLSPTDPEASKTPYGPGEDIRKRVVRLSNAYDHINGIGEDRFFEGLTAESADDDGNTLQGVLDAVSQGSLGLWASYEYLAKIKRAHAVRTNPAFDHKKMAALVNTIGEEGSRAIILNDPALKIAYAELLETLLVVFESDEEAAIAAE